MIQPSDFKNSQIALASWMAAPDELHSVMLAVTQVFMNRAAASERDLYSEVVDWLQENRTNLTFPDCREPQFQQMLNKLDSVTSGMVPDKTGGALWFVPQDRLESMGSAFRITTTLGRMVFLR